MYLDPQITASAAGTYLICSRLLWASGVNEDKYILCLFANLTFPVNKAPYPNLESGMQEEEEEVSVLFWFYILLLLIVAYPRPPIGEGALLTGKVRFANKECIYPPPRRPSLPIR